jgi:uncharacterized SAM-binding protein YcdF (DUF218 family)
LGLVPEFVSRVVGRWVLRAIFGLGLLVLVVTVTPLVRWWTLILSENWTDASGDALVVFGNEMQPDGVIGVVSYWRTVYAVRAWREGKFQRMILCGGPAEHPVAEAMQQFVISQGVDPSRVLVDRESTSTRENALMARRLVGDGVNVVLMTSDYHTFRAIRAARKAGLSATPRPVPDLLKAASNWQTRWDAFLGLGVESVKIVYYWERGWI